jgi:hypothetical protein
VCVGVGLNVRSCNKSCNSDMGGYRLLAQPPALTYWDEYRLTVAIVPGIDSVSAGAGAVGVAVMPRLILAGVVGRRQARQPDAIRKCLGSGEQAVIVTAGVNLDR